MSGPYSYCKIRAALGINQNAPFHPGPVCHIINLHLQPSAHLYLSSNKGTPSTNVWLRHLSLGTYHAQGMSSNSDPGDSLSSSHNLSYTQYPPPPPNTKVPESCFLGVALTRGFFSTREEKEREPGIEVGFFLDTSVWPMSIF